MKYVVFGYVDKNRRNTMSASERSAFMDECFAYDNVLRRNGHLVGGEALQSARNAVTLRWLNDRASVTEGPFAETKEQLSGILVLKARDLNHAILLMSKHPRLRMGTCFEIRPAADLGTIQAQRRREE